MSEAERALTALLALMARLRDPESGCPWDREQTFATIAPYTIEEAYEVADAIERADPEHLREELGDLLFQVVFHARMAEERGWFDFAAVANGIREKLVRRHPHLFAGAALAPADLVRVWEQQKAQERAAAAARTSRARRGAVRSTAGAAGAHAARPNSAAAPRASASTGPRHPRCAPRCSRSCSEVDEAHGGGRRRGAHGGDRRSAVRRGQLESPPARRCRKLRCAVRTAKFEQRFARMEALARARGLELEKLSAVEWDVLWREAKLNGS